MSSFKRVATEMPLAHPRILRTDRLCIGSIRVTYQLLDEQGDSIRYAVQLSTDAECRCVSLGGDLQHAVDVYGALVKGGVTPCTLADVVEDLSER